MFNPSIRIFTRLTTATALAASLMAGLLAGLAAMPSLADAPNAALEQTTQTIAASTNAVPAPSANLKAEPISQKGKGQSLPAKSLTRVSINAADAATLAQFLVGVGPSKASAIVAWRNANGRFTTTEQLLNVKGIGQATLDKNKSRITL